MIKALLGAAALLGVVGNDPTPPPATAPLAPIGKWAVDGSDNQCFLSHDFGSETDKVTLGFRPSPLGGAFEIVVLTPLTKTIDHAGNASITVLPSQRTVTVPFRVGAMNGEKQSIALMTVDGPIDGFLSGASTIRIDFAGHPIELAPPRIDPALAALRKCQDALLTLWGVDPDERDRAGLAGSNPMSWATTDPGAWISYNDYPNDALANHQQGTTLILWAIGIDGRVHDCRVIRSSGVPSLDAASCKAITARGRYRTVLDTAGKPMVLHASRKVVWSLP